MTGRQALALSRVGFAVLAMAAILVQLLDLAGKGTLNPVNYFSYFTIQSNLIAVAALLVAAATWRVARSKMVDFFRGAATTYMTVTFVVFALLLADTDVDTAIVWVDRVLHRVIPIVMMADWLLDPPNSRIDLRRAMWWAAYPVAWVAYTMVRGAIVGTYPYPFLDPANGGYGTVLVYSVAILIGLLIFIYAIVWIGNAMRERRMPEGAR
ncbi:MAG TPA: Pr6Pr family membrane protein [Candidatus Limnocylindria bacterium]|nr:Pr6Pr family membrane protein [Candidatus Limnocylindria bacterium]